MEILVLNGHDLFKKKKSKQELVFSDGEFLLKKKIKEGLKNSMKTNLSKNYWFYNCGLQ